MDTDSLINRATLANCVSAILVLVGMSYCWLTGNTDGVLLIAGAGMGWLFKEVKNG